MASRLIIHFSLIDNFLSIFWNKKPRRRPGPYPKDEALRGQQDYSRAKTPSRKDFKIKIGFLGAFAPLREKISWFYRQFFVDRIELSAVL